MKENKRLQENKQFKEVERLQENLRREEKRRLQEKRQLKEKQRIEENLSEIVSMQKNRSSLFKKRWQHEKMLQERRIEENFNQGYIFLFYFIFTPLKFDFPYIRYYREVWGGGGSRN